MNRFYRHVLIEGGYPHHGAVAFKHTGKAFFALMKLLGVEKVQFNQPARNALQERKSVRVSGFRPIKPWPHGAIVHAALWSCRKGSVYS